MTVKNMFLIAWTAFCAIVSAAFYVLFRQKKEEDQELQEKLEKAEEEKKETDTVLRAEIEYREQMEQVNKLYQEGLKVEEDTIQDLNSSDATVAIAASNKLLNDIRARGKSRNNN